MIFIWKKKNEWKCMQESMILTKSWGAGFQEIWSCSRKKKLHNIKLNQPWMNLLRVHDAWLHACISQIIM